MEVCFLLRFVTPFFYIFYFKLQPRPCKKYDFSNSFLMFLHFNYNPSATTYASKFHQKSHRFGTKNPQKWHSKSIIKLSSILSSILYSFWLHFGTNLGTILETLSFKRANPCARARVAVFKAIPRRLGDLTRTFPGAILAPFWLHFGIIFETLVFKRERGS